MSKQFRHSNYRISCRISRCRNTAYFLQEGPVSVVAILQLIYSGGYTIFILAPFYEKTSDSCGIRQQNLLHTCLILRKRNQTWCLLHLKLFLICTASKKSISLWFGLLNVSWVSNFVFENIKEIHLLDCMRSQVIFESWSQIRNTWLLIDLLPDGRTLYSILLRKFVFEMWKLGLDIKIMHMSRN